MCKPGQLKCVEDVEIIDEKCKSSCEGLIVTSYFKSKMEESTFADFWSKVEKDYLRYKVRKGVDFHQDLKGTVFY